MLSVKGLDVAYGRARVLHRVTLEVGDREIVAILGPNGAGKSTLLKTISGVIRPTSGTIAFDGRDITYADPATVVRGGVVHVPEGRHIFSDLTVEENLRLGGYQRPRPGERERVFDMFPILRERRLQRGGDLSGGEQQMLALGRALMACPRLLLLDEPSLGLGPRIVDRIFGVIATLRASGVAIALVEQNAGRARAIADRAVVIAHGRVAYDGEPATADSALQRAYLGVA